MHSYKKKCVFPHIGNFKLICGPYSCLIDGRFGPILMEHFVCFFKCSLNFQAHVLQFELNKVGYTKFDKFRLQSMSSKLSKHLKKQTNHVLSSFGQFKIGINISLEQSVLADLS